MMESQSAGIVGWVSALDCEPKIQEMHNLYKCFCTDWIMQIQFLPVCRISVYKRITEGKKILSVADLVFIDEEVPLSLKKHQIMREETVDVSCVIFK